MFPQHVFVILLCGIVMSPHMKKIDIKINCFFFPEPPGPPRKVQVDDITKSSCTLTWKAPEFDGGSPVTGYYVERQQAYAARWIKVNRVPVTTPRLDIKDLVEHNVYDFRVAAENKAGLGQPSAATGNITAKDPFDKPGKPNSPDVSDVVKVRSQSKLDYHVRCIH